MQSSQKRSLAIVGTGITAVTAALLLTATGSGAHEAPQPAPAPIGAKSEPAPRIDVVFVLDTTSSMSGLIEGAKAKIWTVANQILAGQPRPDVRFGLVGFRDRGDEYVTRPVALTRDLDAVYDQLRAFRAEGGGDTPEDVNAGLSEALAMGWEPGDKVLRLVFLVGDAPPHDDYGGPRSWELAATARERGIFVNAIRVGEQPYTLQAWERIAMAGGGQVTSVDQSGGMMAVATPYDDELAALNGAYAETTIGYGAPTTRRAFEGKVAARKNMKGEIAASAASYSAKSGAGLGSGDLVADLEAGRVDLNAVPAEHLPAGLADKSSFERKKIVAAKQAKRAELEKRIAEVSKKRDAEIRRAQAANKDGFDNQINSIIEAQAGNSIGVKF